MQNHDSAVLQVQAAAFMKANLYGLLARPPQVFAGRENNDEVYCNHIRRRSQSARSKSIAYKAHANVFICNLVEQTKTDWWTNPGCKESLVAVVAVFWDIVQKIDWYGIQFSAKPTLVSETDSNPHSIWRLAANDIANVAYQVEPVVHLYTYFYSWVGPFCVSRMEHIRFRSRVNTMLSSTLFCSILWSIHAIDPSLTHLQRCMVECWGPLYYASMCCSLWLLLLVCLSVCLSLPVSIALTVYRTPFSTQS